jgi:hypothetical protein
MPQRIGFVGINGVKQIKSIFYTQQTTGLWLISLPVVRLPPIRMMPLHPKTMGNVPISVEASRNQYIYTQQSTWLWSTTINLYWYNG